jgi:L-ascorbate metabolism protein UlaG (beta-lactamase superfamily)
MVWCFIFLFPASSQELIQIPSNTARITYIANAGFLVETTTKRIIIDALFNGLGNYVSPSEETCTKIIDGKYPFNDINLLLITHSDVDHINASLVGEFLLKNNSRHIICSNRTSNVIKNSLGSIRYDKVKDRIIVITPDLYSSMHTKINDIDIDILRLRHSGDYGSEENIGFIITMDGVKVFHGGDNDGYVPDDQEIDGIMEYSKIGITAMRIDIALVSRGMFWEKTAPGLEIVKSYIKPQYLILFHFPKDNYEKEISNISDVIRENKDSLPDITIFHDSLDSKAFQMIPSNTKTE